MKNVRKKNIGFTLLELMIVIAIIGIIATIAYPSYRGYVERINRQAAVAELLDIQSQLERHYTVNNGTYTGFPYSANPNVKGYNIPAPVINNNGQFYTLTAQVIAGGDQKCGNLSIDSTGTQNSTGTTGKNCFR